LAGTVSSSGAVPIRLIGAKSFSGSNGTAGLSSLAIVMLPLIITPIVWLSVLLATMSAAILPPAPTLFSTITGWPSALILTVLVGQPAAVGAAWGLAVFCARLAVATAARARASTVRRSAGRVILGCP
jgi:hypothetical protein